MKTQVSSFLTYHANSDPILTVNSNLPVIDALEYASMLLAQALQIAYLENPDTAVDLHIEVAKAIIDGSVSGLMKSR